MSQYGPTEKEIVGVRPLPTFERELEWTQPRLRRAATSHHRQPLVQPNTRTDVPRGSQPTKGKVLSGPARMLTSLVVKVVCPLASNDSSSNMNASQQNGEYGRRVEFIAGSARG
jgi:hypothetical protein